MAVTAQLVKVGKMLTVRVAQQKVRNCSFILPSSYCFSEAHKSPAFAMPQRWLQLSLSLGCILCSYNSPSLSALPAFLNSVATQCSAQPASGLTQPYCDILVAMHSYPQLTCHTSHQERAQTQTTIFLVVPHQPCASPAAAKAASNSACPSIPLPLLSNSINAVRIASSRPAACKSATTADIRFGGPK